MTEIGEEPVFFIRNDRNAALFSLAAIRIYRYYDENRERILPDGLELPVWLNPKMTGNLYLKVEGFASKSEIKMTRSEQNAFYKLLDFSAKCLLTTDNREVENILCHTFGQSHDKYPLLLTQFMAFAEEIIALINQNRGK